MSSQQLVILSFQDPTGSPLANGSVTLRLQVDISAAVAGGPQVGAGREVSAILDGDGTVTLSLWTNDTSSPVSVYFVTAFTAKGQPVWRGELTVSAGSGSYLLQESGSVFLLETSPIDAIILET